ncbi:MAG: GCN5-related N-acetyltransferase [Anaerocolumna sp.]|jgi:ribosomal-protein-alanine N-acetyltransferase|nr:GCN5-related N-acetyltransferase [Anaerocolumna sp.]
MFESNRLIFRKLEYNDFNLFYELYSDVKVMAYAYLDRIETREEAKQIFSNILTSQNYQGKGVQYVACIRNSDIEIGLVDYEVILNHQNGGIFEIGYFLKPEYWAQGFGTEMARSLINYLFTNSNIHKVIASCNSNNQVSENIMIKLGMKKEGLFKKVRYKNSRWEDEIRYGLLKEEWDTAL